ncbi:uncharacterized protein DEA37_0006329 [Paragonimus westermani]|uniref:Serrate RNA effector molecule n=1 Tax=Paragonimus westermani TaxID=34504 RepID=A0A5J4NJZ1_9TREM|nr:uncharacterized protein DEA37_0006329 [Paragonimus westermani]
MADSDEESERQRSRDKFRRERSDYDNKRRPGDKREPFDDRTGSFGGGYNRVDQRNNPEIRSSGFDRGRSPAAEPPYKRSRRDYNEDYRNTGPRRRDVRNNGNFEDEGFYRPPLVPFKRFLEPLDDLVTEEEACSKYREYKESYSKRHIEDFFEAHKNEEWLRLRYHPDFMSIRKETTEKNLKRRLAVFMELFEKGLFDNQSVQMDNSDNLIRLMDAVVIKLEGGTNEDLKVLDMSDRGRYPDEDESRQRTASLSSTQASNALSSGHKSEEGEAESDLDAEDSDRAEVVDSKPNRTSVIDQHGKNDRASSRDSAHSDRSHRSGTIGSHSGHSSDEEAEDCVKRGMKTLGNEICQASSLNPDAEKTATCQPTTDVSPGDIGDEEDAPTPTTAEPPGGVTVAEGSVDPSILLGSGEPKATTNSAEQRKSPGPSEPTPTKRKYPLHKTASIFFRALPPSVTEAELRELCASQPGFLRLALWEPVPERRFMRHAWATYKPTVNIKKVCWALNTSPLLREKIPLANGELGATVNRDLAQRVRPLTPLTRHKEVMRHDLMLAAQLTARLDNEHGLWESDEKECTQTGQPDVATSSDKPKNFSTLLGLAVRSKNPLLRNLTDYLVEEGGSEEEALLAETNQKEDGVDSTAAGRSNPVVLESDPVLAKALDYLILYLRVVHSVDFYAGAVYQLEDFMPHRCGILHARGDRGLNPALPGGRTAGLVFNQREIDEHLRNFELKLRALIDVPKKLTEEEMKKLGMRDPEKVAEEFVEANIQKRTGKKKPFKVVWVCPLSDKKFREPIFVRKHIFNKHMEKIEAAKKDNAIFFNNYLSDPRRPSLPEAPYHLSQQYFGSSGGGGSGGSYRGSRGGTGRIPGTGNYRGGYRPSNLSNPTSLLPGTGPAYGRSAGAFQDYYDVAAAQQQQQAMAAVAAAAAAALYPNAATAADLYSLAAGPRSGVRRPQRGNSPNDYGSRNYDGRRRQNSAYNTSNRRPYRTGERGMISYNDLDDPGNDGS